MDYQWSEIDRVSKGFPRTRGDRPDVLLSVVGFEEVPPHTRG